MVRAGGSRSKPSGGAKNKALTHFASWSLQNAYCWDYQFAESMQAGEVALAISGRYPWSLASLAATLGDWGKSKRRAHIRR